MSFWLPDSVSVVIPTFNRREHLRRVLEGCARQTLPRDRFEVIVIDDGGSDSSAEVVEETARRLELPIQLLRQENRGPASARNQGIRAATGEIVVFLDDDCVPTPPLLEEHRLAHRVHRSAAIGRIQWSPELEVTPFMRHVDPGSLFNYPAITVRQDAPFLCFYTGNASVDRALLLEVGLFDEDFPFAAGEDLELGYRLRRAGARFAYHPRALAHHIRSVDLAGFLQRQRRAGRSSVLLWQKHPELSDLQPLEELANWDARAHFYEAALRYYWLLGVQEGLDGANGEPVREVDGVPLPDILRSWSQPNLDELLERNRELERELLKSRKDAEGYAVALAAATARVEAREEQLQRVQSAFAEQARWAADLEQRVQAGGSRLQLPRLRGHWPRRREARQPGNPATPDDYLQLNHLARYADIARGIAASGAREVLEVGCGPVALGYFLGRQVVGCDLGFVPNQDRSVAPVMGSALGLPFGDGSFDAVVSLDMLEHLQPVQRAAALQEMARVARNLVVVTCPQGGAALRADRELASWLSRTGQESPEWLREHFELGFPPAGEVDRLLEELGLPYRRRRGEGAFLHLQVMKADLTLRGQAVARWLRRHPRLTRLGMRLLTAGPPYRYTYWISTPARARAARAAPLVETPR